MPPMACIALLKNAATLGSVTVPGRLPTYTLRACRVACWLGTGFNPKLPGCALA